VETFIAITKFPPNAVALKIAVSIAVGMLVGFERESANKDVGTRTFGLAALLGTLSVLAGTPYAVTGMVAVIVLICFMNARSILVSRSLEITTSAALLVTYGLGLLVGMGHTFTPVAAAIVMTLLLAWKVELQRFAGGVSIQELRSAVLLGLIGLVIYPILPDRFLDQWQLVNLREAWITVIVVAGIGFVNYVLLRLYSTRGLYWSALLGGLVNSSAAVFELTSITSGPRTAALVLVATIAMFLRNLAILAIFAPRTLQAAIGPLVAMSSAALVVLASNRTKEGNLGAELKLSSPISLTRVLWFGLLFVLMTVAGTLAERAAGDYGFMVVNGLSGFVSSASATAAAATMSAGGKISPALAGTAAVLASMASALINLPLIVKRSSRPVVARLAGITGLQVTVGLAVLALQHFVLHWG
jgi:uncharacterized membrane protein (DUF4010 family)